ncbi:putative E3 ubiquitin-protein ligase RHY1A [Curcuma longa]|uniref:putative E3 ubiquitin-protein ligase RHY1A n=1 Tax=Curcuma longa TaxID=136217 RepID=UPI003D9F2899
MLSASGLLYSWRSRAGRSHPDPDASLDPLSAAPAAGGDAHPRHSRRHARRRRRLGDGPPQLEPRRTEFEPDWLGSQSDGDSMIGSSIYGASLASTLDRLRLTRNDQLPGVVLQARARLQERLRGISPSGNSQTGLTLDITRNEVAMNDEMRLVNHGEPDAESLVEWFESGSETDGYVQYANRPPGLSSKAFSNLQMEVYRDGVEGENVERACLDCSICLERFAEGEELIQLSCRHRFHPDCLEPWAKICGECPYCRTTI